MRRGPRLAALISVLSYMFIYMVAPAAVAQEATTLSLTTPYPGVAVEPGDDANFDLTVATATDGQVTLAVTDVPDGWTAVLRGGGFVVQAVTVTEGAAPSLRLEVEVPPEASEGTYRITVEARQGEAITVLPLSVEVSLEAVGGVTITPEAQLLNGASDATFTFNLDIENDTPAEVTLELFAIGPEGWQVQAQPAGQRQASSVTVTAGGTSRITVTANSAVDTTAGDYELLATASGGGHQLQVPLLVRITGTFDMTFITAEERLNAEVSAGNPSQLGLLVINTGTAPLRGVVLSATAPSGWEVAFTPDGIDAVEANATTEVVATITPAGNAIAGDYVISFRANVAEVQSSIEVRTTVNPSAVWGFVGIGAIAIALAALAWVFRRFGRR